MHTALKIYYFNQKFIFLFKTLFNINIMEENNIIQEKVNKVNGDILIKEYVKGKLLGKGGFAKCYEFIN